MSDLKFDHSSGEPHEILVRDYLSDRLDGKLGGAEARFRRFLTQGHDESAPISRNPFHISNRFRGWTFGVVGAALAASLAALWAGPSLAPLAPQKPGLISTDSRQPTLVDNPILVQQDVQSQTFDDGEFMMDGDTPVRVLRRRDLQRTRWFDDSQKLQGEQVAPQDHVIYERMKTY